METSVNNKCKAFTSLEQSRKLAEILPLKSADMYYFRQIDNDYFPPNVESICPIPLYKDGKEDFNYDIRCWSFAALLSVIPNYKLSSEHNYHICTAETSFGKKTVAWFDNPVDACYEMILKLKEKELI